MADDPLDRLAKDIQRTADIVKNVKSLRPKINELSEIIEASGRHAAELVTIDLPGEPLLDDLKEELRKLQEFGSILKRQLDTFGQKLTVLEDFVHSKFSGRREIPLNNIQELCQKLIATYNTSNVSLTNLTNFIGCFSDSQLLAQKLEEKLKQQSKDMDKKASRSRNWGAAGTIGLAALGAGAVALGFFTGGATWVAAGAITGTACGAGAGAVAKYTSRSVKEMRSMAADIKEKSNKLHVIAKELEDDVGKAIRMNGEATLDLQCVLEFFSKDELIAQQQKELAAKDEMIARLNEQLKQHGKI